MKKTLFFLACTVLFMISCQKEKYQIEQEFTYTTNSFERLKTPSDLQNEKINMILFYFGKSINSAIQNIEFRKLIIDEIISSSENEVSIIQLIEESPSLKNFMETELIKVIDKNPYSNLSINSDKIIKSLKDQMIHSEYAYEPVIYSIKDLNPNKNELIIAIGEQVNEKDNIFGWKDDKEILISENDAENSLINLLIVGNGNGEFFGENEEISNFVEFENNSQEASPRMETLRNKKYQIKDGYRYESTGKSQVHMHMMTSSISTPTLDIPQSYEKKVYVKKIDIENSVIFDVNHFFGGNYTTTKFTVPTAADFYFLAFEHDWWASQKYPGCACNTCENSTYYPNGFVVKMKFNHEWYMKYCNALDRALPFPATNFEVSNEKSLFNVHRE